MSGHSDYVPLWLKLKERTKNGKRKRKGKNSFRFETLWLHDLECREKVEGAWQERKQVTFSGREQKCIESQQTYEIGIE